IAISGGTGFIGKYLSTFFIQKGYTVYILSRKKTAETSDPNLQYVQWTPDLQTFPLSSIDVVINLAGESINSRWTKKQKKVILNSISFLNKKSRKVFTYKAGTTRNCD
ncbi:NAD-dependent epimerase/dehydratase family protein, partial [Bacillus sp. D-CC]